MKMSLSFLTVVGMLLSAAASGLENYTIDRAHTNILLKVSHVGFSNFYLEVRDYEGSFKFNKEAPQNSSVNVSIEAASIDGDHDGLNEHLRGADFFEVNSYPNITFSSTDVKVTGEQSGLVSGDLTIKGITRPIVLDVMFNKKGVNPFSKDYTAGFSGTATINRSDFGISYALPAISDAVEIILEVEGIRQDDN